MFMFTTGLRPAIEVPPKFETTGVTYPPSAPLMR